MNTPKIPAGSSFELVAPTAFDRELQRILDRVHRCAVRQNLLRTECNSPAYWQQEKEKMQDPASHSYAALAPLVYTD